MRRRPKRQSQVGLQKWKLVSLNEIVSSGKTRHAHSNSEPQSGPRESVQVSDYQRGTPGLGSGNMERGRVLQGGGGGRGPPEGLWGSSSNHRGFMGLKGPDWSSFPVPQQPLGCWPGHQIQSQRDASLAAG